MSDDGYVSDAFVYIRDRKLGYPTFDVDNHLYENPDAMTKFLPSEYEGIIKYVDINGRIKVAYRDQISEYIPNPTFNRVAPPGEDPVAVFRRNIFAHIFREPNPKEVADLVGCVDNILWGFDFPHPEGLADPLGYSELVESQFSREDTAKIMGGNLARVMKVEV